MKKKMCKYCEDAFCENRECPMSAEYCPVTHRPDICKYAELVDVVLSPKECLRVILNDNGFEVRDDEMKRVWDDFVELMAENGHVIVGVDALKTQVVAPRLNGDENKRAQFWVGQEVRFADILASTNWTFQRYVNDEEGCAVAMTYITKDGEFEVSFDQEKMKNNGASVIRRRQKYYVGQELSAEEVEKSDYWKTKSINANPFDNTCTYINHNKTMIITIEHGKDHGIVQEFDEFDVGKRVHIHTIEESPKWVDIGSENGDTGYLYEDGKRIVSFGNGCKWSVVELMRDVKR